MTKLYCPKCRTFGCGAITPADDAFLRKCNSKPTYGPQAHNSFKNMKQSFADQCLKRAEKATPQGEECCEKVFLFSPEPVDIILSFRATGVGYAQASANHDFYFHARTDVPELARRLKLSLAMNRSLIERVEWDDREELETVKEHVDELEAMPEGEK